MPKIRILWLWPDCSTKQGFGVTKDIKSCWSTKSPHYILTRNNFCTCLNPPMSGRKFWSIEVNGRPKCFEWKFLLSSHTPHNHFTGSKWAHRPCLVFTSAWYNTTCVMMWHFRFVFWRYESKLSNRSITSLLNVKPPPDGARSPW